MRKITISLLALLLALPTMAATISGGTKLYLTPNSNWKQSGARYAAYFFGDGEGWASMTKVEGETDLYEVTSPAGKNFTNVIFCRMNPGATTNNWNNKWNQTSDLTYDGTNNHYTVKEGTWDQGGGTWDYYGTSVEVMVGLAYTPTKIFEGDVVTFTANIVNGPADATTTYYVNGVELDGNTWTAVAGNHTASVTVAYGSGSVSDEVSLKVEAVTSSFNVYLEKDGTWAAANIYYWGDASNSWPGEEMKTTTVNDVEYFYYTFRNVKTVNIIFNSNNVQTEDINNVTGEQFYKLGAKSGSKYTVTTGGSTTDPDPDPETGLTYNVTVPEGTPGCFIAGEMNGWSHQEMTKVDDTHYTITIAGATTAMKYKYAATAGWDNVEVQANGTDVADRTYSENDVVAAWKGISVSPEAETLVYNVTVPEGTPACYIVGDMTSWSFVAMTKVDDTHYTITYDNVTKATAYKYACGEDWAYVEKGANGEELQNRTYTENDVVAKWAAVPVVEPETETLVYNVTVPAGTPACYIVGAFNDWGVFEPMTKVDDTHYTITIENVTKATEYKYTCGEHWDYVEVLENNRTWSESDVVTAWAKVPFVGLVYNVTVPEGTPGCFIAGEMNDWSFTEMEKVDDTHYTIAIANATNAMKYKYAATGSWDNVEIQASGADVENRSYSENDVVEAWKGISVSPEAETLVYNVTVPEGTPACYIVGEMNGWSFTAMTKVDDTHYTITYDNVTKATAYKYTCGEDWAYVEKGANGEELHDRTYTENDVVAKWAAVPVVEPETETLVYNVTVPAGTPACYIVGAFNDWGVFEPMTKVDDTHYTITIENVTKATEYKYTCGEHWDYVEVLENNRTWSESDVVTAWAKVPFVGLVYNVTVPEGTPGCFIAGEMNDWALTEMEKVDDTHYTIAIANATNAMKYKYAATGSWDNVEIQASGADVENRSYSENDVVEAWKGISVSPEAETLVYNVTVPEGTPACYIVGEMNGWSFTAMTKVDDTHYTITYDNVTKATAYKYTCGEGWAYVEKGANGEELQNRTYSENDVVAKWAAIPEVTPEPTTLTYNVEVPVGTEKCFIAGEMNGWTFTEMEMVDATHYTITLDNVTTATEYKYACGNGWEYVETQADGKDVANRTWCENDVVVRWKNTWTNVSDIIANSLKVYGVNDAIRVTAAEATTLYIYNAQGQLIMTTLVNGDETIALTQGLYIVNNNKVLVY